MPLPEADTAARAAPGDTGVFRERGRTVGVCRVESATGTKQGETGVTHKAGTS